MLYCGYERGRSRRDGLRAELVWKVVIPRKPKAQTYIGSSLNSLKGVIYVGFII